jgi:hypothetical protein
MWLTLSTWAFNTNRYSLLQLTIYLKHESINQGNIIIDSFNQRSTLGSRRTTWVSDGSSSRLMTGWAIFTNAWYSQVSQDQSHERWCASQHSKTLCSPICVFSQRYAVPRLLEMAAIQGQEWHSNLELPRFQAWVTGKETQDQHAYLRHSQLFIKQRDTPTNFLFLNIGEFESDGADLSKDINPKLLKVLTIPIISLQDSKLLVVSTETVFICLYSRRSIDRTIVVPSFHLAVHSVKSSSPVISSIA